MNTFSTPTYSFTHSIHRTPESGRRLGAWSKKALAKRKGAISYQVVQELLNAAARKFARPLTPQQAERYLNTVLEPLCIIFGSIDLFRKAIDVQRRWRFGFYDALVIAAALQAACRTLYTEDLQHGQSVESLTVVDPFR